MPTTCAPLAASRRLTWPSPQPMSSTVSSPASSCAANGRICSSYSASAPPVNSSIHHSAYCSQRSREDRVRRRRPRLGGYGHSREVLRLAQHGAPCRRGTRHRALGRRRRLVRRLVRRPLHAQHRHGGDQAGRHARVLGDVAGDRRRHRTCPHRLARGADVDPPPRRARQPGKDDRPRVRRADGARPRRRVADQRAPAYGIELEPPGRRVQRFEEAIQIIRSLTTEESHDVRRRDLHDHRCARRSQADPAAAAAARRHGADRACCGSSPATPTSGTRGATSAATWKRRRRSRRHASRRVATRLRCTHRYRRSRSSPRTQRSIERAGTGAFADRTLAGSVAQIVDAIGRYAELGFGEFIVPDANLGRRPDAAPRAIRTESTPRSSASASGSWRRRR